MACSNGIHIATWGDSTSAPAGPVPKARCDCGAFATATPDPRTTTTEGRDEHPIVSSVRSAYWWAGKSIHNVMAWDSEQWEPIEAACEEATESIRQIEQERDALRVDLTRARLERDDARSWAARWKAWAKGCHSQRLSWRQRAYAVWQREHAPALAARTAELAALREAVNRAVADLEICSMQSSPTLQWEHFKRALRALAAAPEPSADAAQEASS